MTRSKLRKIRRIESKRSRALLRRHSARGRAAGQRRRSSCATGGRQRAAASTKSWSPRSRPSRTCRTSRFPSRPSAPSVSNELGVNGFDDYVKFLPSVSFQQAGPGFARVFMRGVAAGDNGNHSGPLPSVGLYLDEQPITTIQGALDIHMYDIARVEALAGPQGTLYGASSQAGTIRIITNKPDKSGFEAGYSLEGNTVADGDAGYVAEGFVNMPLGEQRRHPPGRLGPPRRGLHRQRRGHAHLPHLRHRDATRWPRTTTTTSTPTARARRSRSTSTTTGRITPTVMAQKQEVERHLRRRVRRR